MLDINKNPLYNHLPMVGSEVVIAFQQKIIESVNEHLRAPTEIIVGDGCEELFDNTLFYFCLQELLENCSKKQAPSLEIDVHLNRNEDGYMLTVEDNVKYGEDIIDAIIKNLNSPKPYEFGKIPNTNDELPGVGIAECRIYFKQRNGSLIYKKSEDNRVIVEAHWVVDGTQV